VGKEVTSWSNTEEEEVGKMKVTRNNEDSCRRAVADVDPLIRMYLSHSRIRSRNLEGYTAKRRGAEE
jgi:hypothetical protein